MEKRGAGQVCYGLHYIAQLRNIMDYIV